MNIATVYTAATMPVLVQTLIGIMLFLIVVRSMRNHSGGYTAAVVIAVAAPLYIQNLAYMAAAIVGAGIIGLITVCSRAHHS
jgi:asparagine N-glycosylation enzyme membrane subunit Stt3